MGNEVCGSFEFTRPQDSKVQQNRLRLSPVFDAWYEGRPDKRFVLTPIRGKSGEIVGLSMTFAEVPKFKALFVNVESKEDSKTVSKPPLSASKTLPARKVLRKKGPWMPRRSRTLKQSETLPQRTFDMQNSTLFKLRQRLTKGSPNSSGK